MADVPPGQPDDLDVNLEWPAAEEGEFAFDDDLAAPDPGPSSTSSLDDDDDDGDDDGDDDRAPTDLLPAVPLLPSIAGRVDALDGQLRAISMRLDVLGSSVSALRSSIGDRVDAYAEAAAATARQADDALDEHRHNTQKLVGELRRAVQQTEAGVRRLAGRLEEVASDVEALLDATMPDVPEREQVERAPVPSMAAVDLEPVQRTLDEVKALVELLVDLMPDSEEGTGEGLERRIADAVVARLAFTERPAR